MVLTAYSALSLVTGLYCHHHPCDAARIITSLNASVGASGPHDFTVRSTHHSSCTHAQLIPPRPPHPDPTFVTMANAPLAGRDGIGLRTDLARQGRAIFFAGRLDRRKQIEMA